MKRVYAFSALLVASVIFTGCAGRKLRSDLPKNVSISSTLTDSSNTINSALFVFSIDAKCQWSQIAEFKLEPGTVELGLPPGEKLALEFAYSATSMFSPNRQVSHQLLFTAKDRAKYKIESSYNKGMYFVEVKEMAAGQRQGRLIERVDPQNCQATE